MNSKNLRVRMDQSTGDLWLVEEKYKQPIRRIKNITGDVLLALSAEIVAEEGTRKAERQVQFSDGCVIKLTVEDLSLVKDPLIPEQSKETH